MAEYTSGAYIVSRRSRGNRNRDPRHRPKRAAAILIAVLLLLTAGICILVVFLPKLKIAGVGGTPSFSGRTYYFLTTAKATDRLTALEQAEYAIERGGAGYIYNDGNYRIIAAVYEREADAKTLASLNTDSEYFAVPIHAVNCSENDKALLDYLTGDWFSAVDAAVTELDRGNITEASAEFAVRSALGSLSDLAYTASSERVKDAILAAAEYDIPYGRSVLSYIRFIHVRAIIYACNAVS